MPYTLLAVLLASWSGCALAVQYDAPSFNADGEPYCRDGLVFTSDRSECYSDGVCTRLLARARYSHKPNERQVDMTRSMVITWLALLLIALGGVALWVYMARQHAVQARLALRRCRRRNAAAGELRPGSTCGCTPTDLSDWEIVEKLPAAATLTDEHDFDAHSLTSRSRKSVGVMMSPTPDRRSTDETMKKQLAVDKQAC
jgi:hypothetical protein